MAHSLLKLLAGCAEFTLQRTDEIESTVLDELNDSPANVFVNAVRMCQVQRAILAVGMFSMFEAARESR